MSTSRTSFLRIGEDGFVFQLKTSYRTNSFDSAALHFTDPNGDVTEKACDVFSSGDGEWGWTVESGFFDGLPGWWMVSLEVDLGASGTRKSVKPATFLVGDDLS
jgi:hypothetical protein